MNLHLIKRPALCVLILLTSGYFGCKKSNTGPDKKTQSVPLAITTISANSGPFNTTVEITGTGFDPSPANDQVFFNGKAATISAATATKLTAVVPLGAGTGQVSVAVNNGTTVSGPVFTYQLTAFVSTLAGQLAHGFADGKGTSAAFYAPTGLTIDASGNLYVVDMHNYRIRKVDAAGNVTTFAGSGRAGTENGTGTAASFFDPARITKDSHGNFYITDQGNNLIRKMTATGVVTTITGNVAGVPLSNWLSYPEGIAVDASGNIYVADTGNSIIRKISPDGKTDVIIAGNRILGTSDGTGSSVSFHGPIGMAFKNNGLLLYIADSYNNSVRQMNLAGTVLTFLGSNAAGSGSSTSFNHPVDVTFDAANNMYIVDQGNNKIVKMTIDGVVTTLAGSGAKGSADGPANQATFNAPTGIVADASGNIYIADQGNNLIRKISYQ